MTVSDLPAVNASLNGTATVLISAGFIYIKRAQSAPSAVRRNALIRSHRRCMLVSAVVSALFLISYLTYHGMRHGMHTPFGGQGAIRTVYLIILWTHIPLAALIAFLVPRTFVFALKGDYERHRKWARVTFPIWYYVSVTGVMVYFFLYVWWPAAK